MQIGVVFPQTEIGGVGRRRACLRARVEELGFAHVLAYDHVLGADPEVHAAVDRPVRRAHHVPRAVRAVRLPRRAHVAGAGHRRDHPAAAPDRARGQAGRRGRPADDGRFRLGVGLGWNAVEYEALGKTFTNRGRRMDEQITLLRRLWTEPTVTHDGEFEHVTGAGLAPLPVQRPIPIWIGAQSPPAYRRVGRLADGWFPQVPPGPKLDEARAVVARAADGPDGIQQRSAWKDGSAGPMPASASWSTRSADGATPAPRTCRSTR